MNSSPFFKKLKAALEKVEHSGEPFEFTKDVAVYLIGNGGSCTIAQHIAVDLIKQGFSAFALTDPAVMSMCANDIGWHHAFSAQIYNHGRKGTLLVAISSSGQSQNIVGAASMARGMGMQVVTLSGFKPDNPLREVGHSNFYVPSSNYGVVEIAHLTILHALANPGEV